MGAGLQLKGGIGWVLVFIATIMVAAALAVLCVSYKDLPARWDGNWYLAIAQGRYHALDYYYARRILHPLTARLLVHLFSLTWGESFYLLACASLGVYLLSVEFYLLSSTEVNFTLAALPLLITPALFAAFRDMYYYCLFFSALLATFFLVLKYRPWMSLLLLLLLNLTRESALILDLAVVVVAAWRRYYSFAGAAGIVSIIGLTAAARFIPVPLANNHQLSALVFYPLKVFYDVSENVFGLVVWTNTVGASLMACLPRYVLHLPEWPALFGKVREIGLCRFDPRIPLRNALGLATLFGAMPAVLGWAAVRRRLDLAGAEVAIALVYGLAAFALSLAIGTDVDRYASDSFPAFWLVGLVVLYQITKGQPRLTARLALLSCVVTWRLPIALSGEAVLNYDPSASLKPLLVTVVLTVALYALAVKWLEDADRARIQAMAMAAAVDSPLETRTAIASTD